MLEFDADGRFLNAWGGAAEGHDWPVTEHGITVEVDKNIVWIGGSGVSDDFLLKYDLQGKFLKEFFGKGVSKGNADTMALNRPSDAFIYRKTNEVFVSDGYGNRRLIVLDADRGRLSACGDLRQSSGQRTPAGGFGASGGGPGEKTRTGGAAAVRDRGAGFAAIRQSCPCRQDLRTTIWCTLLTARTGAFKYSHPRGST